MLILSGFDLGQQVDEAIVALGVEHFMALLQNIQCLGPGDSFLLLAVVESLDPHTRALWDGCSRREFDFAYDCGVKPMVRHDLSAGTMARLAAASSGKLIMMSAELKWTPANQPVAASSASCHSA